MARTMDLGAVKGAEGKSAYQYAQDGGYTGTEEEFRALMAEVPVHVSDTEIHITADERMAWNNKASSTHASQHASGGSDPITPVAIGAFHAYANYGNGIFGNDLNDWVTPGAYCVAGKSQGTLNTPVDGDGWGTILVSGGFNDRVFQIFSAWNANTLYWRANHGGTWTSWYKFYDTLNKPTTSDVGITAGTTDLTAGSSALTTNAIYLVYE